MSAVEEEALSHVVQALKAVGSIVRPGGGHAEAAIAAAPSRVAGACLLLQRIACSPAVAQDVAPVAFGAQPPPCVDEARLDGAVCRIQLWWRGRGGHCAVQTPGFERSEVQAPFIQVVPGTNDFLGAKSSPPEAKFLFGGPSVPLGPAARLDRQAAEHFVGIDGGDDASKRVPTIFGGCHTSVDVPADVTQFSPTIFAGMQRLFPPVPPCSREALLEQRAVAHGTSTTLCTLLSSCPLGHEMDRVVTGPEDLYDCDLCDAELCFFMDQEGLYCKACDFLRCGNCVVNELFPEELLFLGGWDVATPKWNRCAFSMS